MQPHASTSPPGPVVPSPLAVALAHRMKEAREMLARRWLERIVARVTMPANHVFPTQDLLNHVPRLIEGIAHHFEDPSTDVATVSAVEAEATALGKLRYAQGFDANQILKEYDLLGDILFHHLIEEVGDIAVPVDARELLRCAHRLFHAVVIVQATTTMQFLRLSDARVADREARLLAFNRMVSHEIKNDIGAILGAGEILETIENLDEAKQKELRAVVTRRAKSMKETVDMLVELSRVEVNARAPRHLRLPEVVAEAARRVRDQATAFGVELRVSSSMPDVEVNAAVVEFALANYLSNAIKYSKHAAAGAFVTVEAKASDGAGAPEVIISVRDNGIGVAPEKRPHLFEQFYRADAGNTEVDGTGLGLSLVREMIESLGGRAWAEFPPEHTVFLISLPPV